MPLKILTQVQSLRFRKCNSLHITPPFLHRSPFHPTPKMLCFTMLFSPSDTAKNAHFHDGIYIVNVIHLPWTTWLSDLQFTMCINTQFKHVHQQDCKTQIPPHSLTWRHPQFRLSTEPRRRCQQMICRTCLVYPRFLSQVTLTFDLQNGRRPVQIVLEHARKI